MQRWYRRVFVETWERINRQAAADRAQHPGFDSRVMVALVLAAFILIFQEYYGDRPTYEALFGERFAGARYDALGSFGWWAGAKLVGYFVVPALAVWGVMRGRLRDYGLSTRGMSRHVWIYVALFGAILPIVIFASYTRPFLATYPFYKYAARSWPDFIAWELMYGASFVALEFFFRGFLLFSLERQMGAYAIFVMVVPYCMIHFNKPVAEVCGAIFAGIVLGTLSMATRSIWCGVLIHVSVAWTMDCLALLHTTGFPGSGRFIGEYVP
jgi:CAAX protease family protein